MTLKDALVAAHEATDDMQTLDTARIFIRDELDGEWQEVEFDALDEYNLTHRTHLRAYTSIYVYTTPLVEGGEWTVTSMKRSPRAFSPDVIYEFPL